MTTRTWFGGTGNFNNANDWSPAGVPQSGDTAEIDSGTVRLHNQVLSGVTIDLHGTVEATPPVLALRNVALDSSTTINLTGPATTSIFFGEMDVSGVVLNAGSIVEGTSSEAQSGLTMDLSPHSAFVNTGSITVGTGPSFFDVNAPERGSVFFNTGTVQMFGGTATIDAPVYGNGTFQMGPFPTGGGNLIFGEDVGKDVKVNLAELGNTVTLDEPMQFLGSISGFGGGDTIALPNLHVTSESFADNELSLFSDDKLLAKLNIIGNFTTNQFFLTSVNGGTEITLFAPPPSGAPAALADPQMSHSSAVPVLTHA
jgi:hypothetical protein